MITDLAVDGGQSGLRIAVLEEGRVARTLRAAGFRYEAGPDGVAHDAASLVARLPALDCRPRRVAMGLTNAPGTTRDRDRFAELVRTALDADEVLVTTDMVTAHAGALGGADGIVVAAGTGAVGFGRCGAAHARTDGFGYLLGDDGSGFAIGRAGLRAALRAAEGRAPATALAAAARRRFGEAPAFPHGLYRDPDVVRRIAEFTADVAAAADAGDAVARAICFDAVDELVSTVRSTYDRCPGLADADTVLVSYTGGLFDVVDHVRRPFRQRVESAVPRADVRPPSGDPLAGAIQLVRGLELNRELVSRSTAVPA